MIFRVEKTKNYTVMSNEHLKNKNLSLKAKGLLSVMLALPDDWDYSISGLVSICKENETAIKSALNELKNEGYLTVEKLMPEAIKDENGNIIEVIRGRIEYVYTVYESSIQHSDFQCVEIQSVENIAQLNTNKQNTKNKNNTLSKDKVRTEPENFSFGTSNKSTKPKKKTNEEEYNDCCLVIDNYTENKELRKLLKELFRNKKDRCSNSRYHFYSSTCVTYLNDLDKMKDTSDENKIGAVKLSLQYNSTLRVMEPNKPKYNNDVDKYLHIPIHEDNEKLSNEDIELATNEDGSYKVF